MRAQVVRSGRTTKPLGARRDAEWDEVLEAIDMFLIALQAKHLREVDEAGASGRSTNY